MYIPMPQGSGQRDGGPRGRKRPPQIAMIFTVCAVAGAAGVANAAKEAHNGAKPAGPIAALVIISAAIAVGVVMARLKQASTDDETADDERKADPGNRTPTPNTAPTMTAPIALRSADEADDAAAEDSGPIALATLAVIVAVVAIVAALMFLARPARAQSAPEQSAIVVTKGTDTLVVQRLSRTAGAIQSDASVRGGARITYVATLGEGPNVPQLAMQAYAPGAAAEAAPAQQITVTIGADTAAMEAVVAGTNRRFPTAIKGPALPFMSNEFAFIDLLIARARKAGDSPHTEKVYVVQGAGAALDATVALIGRDSAVFSVGGQEQRYALDASGRIRGGRIESQNLTITRVTGAAALKISLGRPDYGAPANAPYTAEEVTVPTRAGHMLTGTLTIPKGINGKLPAVVTITGSGQEDRDEYIPLVPNYRPFRQLADTLGRRGIAVLRLDDRGINGSGGNVTNATSADFADDIRAGVAYLRTRAEIDAARIALFGHSEGGMIGPMVASTDSKLAALVIFAGPAYTGRKIIDFQLRNLVMGNKAIPAAKKDSAVKAQFAAWDSTSGKAPWMKYFLDYDPLPTLKKVRTPTLILQGGTDQQVTPEQAPIIEKTLKDAGNKDVTMRVFPNRNHLFVPDSIGFPGDYVKLKDGRIGADVMGPLTDWLVLKLSAKPKP